MVYMKEESKGVPRGLVLLHCLAMGQLLTVAIVARPDAPNYRQNKRTNRPSGPVIAEPIGYKGVTPSQLRVDTPQHNAPNEPMSLTSFDSSMTIGTGLGR